MPIYDVENRFSYYKSYSDNIMSGSALPSLGSSTWDRGVIGSVVSGSEEWRASTVWSDYLFKVSSSFFRSGEVRYLRLSSNSQTIEDSYVPDIIGIYSTGSYGAGKFVYDDSGGAAGAIYMYLSRDGTPITGSNGNRVNNIEWNFSFPFEKKYYRVSKDILTNNVPITLAVSYSLQPINQNIFSALTPTINKTINKDSISSIDTFVLSNSFYKSLISGIDAVGSAYPLGGGSYGGFNPDPPIISSYYLNVKATYQNFFGINPRYIFKAGAQTDGSSSNYLLTTSAGAIAEGWKYGLYNGLPTNFSAVFRQNHYGQFRDMLEQRIYTATYNNPQIGGPMDANGGIKFISGSSLAGESNNELTASIYNEKPDKLNVAEAYRVNPYGSGIFDTLYRASQPWHDDDTRITVRGGV